MKEKVGYLTGEGYAPIPVYREGVNFVAEVNGVKVKAVLSVSRPNGMSSFSKK